MPRRLAFLPAAALLSALAGCSTPRGGAASPSPPVVSQDVEPVHAVVPVVRVAAGEPDTLLLADLMGTTAPVRFAPHPDVRLSPIGGGRVVVEARGGFAGLTLIPFEVGGSEYVLAVESEAPDGMAGRLHLRAEGAAPDDASLLRFSVRRTTAAGADTAAAIDEEEGVVALLDNRPFQDNAVDAFDGTVVLDLDAAGPGPQRLRVAVRADGLVSNWVEVLLFDGRPAR